MRTFAASEGTSIRRQLSTNRRVDGDTEWAAGRIAPIQVIAHTVRTGVVAPMNRR